MIAPTYGVGDRVAYASFLDEARIVEVTRRHVYAGRPAFDGVVVGTGETVWGYDDQIVATTARPDGGA